MHMHMCSGEYCVESERGYCCEWQGIECGNHTHVIKLDFHAAHYPNGTFAWLGGHIDPTLVELIHLSFLNLSYNNFSFTPIPEFLGSLTELKTLDLSHAGFEGKIPPQLGNLTELQHLDLSEDYGDLTAYNLDISSLQLLKLNYLNLSMVRPDFPRLILGLPLLTEVEAQYCKLLRLPPNVSFTKLYFTSCTYPSG
ncbi:hypothetical protein AMTR_s00052p00211390 [Amborella trichopoda]|uniref:Leucine-rich repeat-containing N-terminal plant-type domain-containing protein n=1 Tax=Amborella trichopoda TaxID=13333 RepID=U5CT79_AMBTC|nr:hypothetical protein AMTR_s00052p00211390 [Amborella trichopoda]